MSSSSLLTYCYQIFHCSAFPTAGFHALLSTVISPDLSFSALFPFLIITDIFYTSFWATRFPSSLLPTLSFRSLSLVPHQFSPCYPVCMPVSHTALLPYCTVPHLNWSWAHPFTTQTYMHSFVKTFQRTPNGIFTTNTCKQHTLPFSLLTSRTLFFTWPLYSFLSILPDDLISCFESCSHIVWVLPLFWKKRILEKKHDLGTHISHFTALLPWIMQFIELSVVTLARNYFQLWPGSLPSCFLFSWIFTTTWSFQPHLGFVPGPEQPLDLSAVLAWSHMAPPPCAASPSPAAQHTVFHGAILSHSSPPSSHWL